MDGNGEQAKDVAATYLSDNRVVNCSRKQKNPAFAGVLLSLNWLRGLDLNQRPSGYEPDELPGCSTPRSRRRNMPEPQSQGKFFQRGDAQRSQKQRKRLTSDENQWFTKVLFSLQSERSRDFPMEFEKQCFKRTNRIAAGRQKQYQPAFRADFPAGYFFALAMICRRRISSTGRRFSNSSELPTFSGLKTYILTGRLKRITISNPPKKATREARNPNSRFCWR